MPPNYDGRSLTPLLIGEPSARAEARREWRTRTVISFAEGYAQLWGSTTFSHGADAADPQRVVSPPNASASGVTYAEIAST